MVKAVIFMLLVPLTLMSLTMHAQTLSGKSPIRLLALGDSYTIGENVAEDQRWPVQLKAALTRKGFSCEGPIIVAATGWRTDELRKALAELHLAEPYNLVSLLIGVNNQYQGEDTKRYEHEFDAMLATAIRHAGGDASNAFVLSIPDYGYTPFGKEKREMISNGIDDFNAINKKVSTQRGVTYIDITDISRRGLTDTSLVAEDGLHPSGKMYALWVERILERLKI